MQVTTNTAQIAKSILANIDIFETSDLLAFRNEVKPEAQIKKFTNRDAAEKQCLSLAAVVIAQANAIDMLGDEAERTEQAEEAAPVTESTAVAVVEGEQAAQVVESTEAAPEAEEAAPSASKEDIAKFAKMFGITEEEAAKEFDKTAATGDADEGDEEDHEAEEARLAAETAAENGKGAQADEAKKRRSNTGASNSLGVMMSWRNPFVREKRLTRHAVAVNVDGAWIGYNSVASAFRALRLPMAKHIKFRKLLKEAGVAVFDCYEFSLGDVGPVKSGEAE